MKNDDLFDALLGIDEKYIEHSEDLKGVSAEHKQAKVRKAVKAVSFSASLVIAVIVGVNVNDMNIFDRNDIIKDPPLTETIYTGTIKTDAALTSVLTRYTEETNTSLKRTEKTSAYRNDSTASKPKSSIITAQTKTYPETESVIVNTKIPDTKVSTANAKTKISSTAAVTLPAIVTSEGSTTAVTKKITGISSRPTTDKGEGEIDRNKWENMKIYEQYDIVFNNGTKYFANTVNVAVIGSEKIGGKIDHITVDGFDKVSNLSHTAYAEIFTINNISADDGIAVKFIGDDNYYVYTSMEYLMSNNNTYIDF